MALLEVNDLSVSFSSDGKLLPAVSNVSFAVEEGEILALVGESAHTYTHTPRRENSLPIPRDLLWKYRWCKDTKRA